MSRHGEGGIWPFGGESKGSHNLYDRRPTYSNDYGQYYEVEATQFRQLRDIDVAISLANISEVMLCNVINRVRVITAMHDHDHVHICLV